MLTEAQTFSEFAQSLIDAEVVGVAVLVGLVALILAVVLFRALSIFNRKVDADTQQSQQLGEQTKEIATLGKQLVEMNYVLRRMIDGDQARQSVIEKLSQQGEATAQGFAKFDERLELLHQTMNAMPASAATAVAEKFKPIIAEMLIIRQEAQATNRRLLERLDDLAKTVTQVSQSPTLLSDPLSLRKIRSGNPSEKEESDMSNGNKD
jgi:predicted component of type VI protein secretion system